MQSTLAAPAAYIFGRKLAQLLGPGYDQPLMEPLAELFRQHLETEKRCSANTTRAYLRDLTRFFDHVGAARTSAAGSITVPELDLLACRAFLASLHRLNDPTTVGRKLSALRTFFRLLVRGAQTWSRCLLLDH